MELRHLLEILYRKRWIIITTFMSLFLTVVIGTLMVTPWYDTSAKVILRKSPAMSSLLSSLGQTSQVSNEISESDISNYIALATSRMVVDSVITKLNLTRERTRSRIMKTIPFLKPVLRVIGVDVKSTGEVMTAEQLTHKSILSCIFPKPYVEVSQYQESDILEIQAISPNPDQAEKIANALANAIIENEISRIRKDHQATILSTEKGLKKARSRFIEELDAVQDYKQREAILDMEKEIGKLLERLNEYELKMEDTRVSMAKTKASMEQAEEQLKTIPQFQKSSEQLGASEILKQLRQNLTDVYLQIAENKSILTSDHPIMIEHQDKIVEIKNLIRTEVEKEFASETVSIDSVHQNLREKVASYYTDMAGYSSQTIALNKLIYKYETKLLNMIKNTFEYTQIELAADTSQGVYKDFLAYKIKLSLAELADISNIFLIEPAITPSVDDSKHKHPNLLLNLIIAIFLGSVFGIIGGLLADYIDDSIKTPEDVKSISTLTCLGTVNRLKKKQSKLISESVPRSKLNESIRTIRRKILFSEQEGQTKSLMVTSTIRGEGRSFIAANVAIAFANQGKRVLLVNSDWRAQGAEDYFAVTEHRRGLTNILLERLPWENMAQESGIDFLKVIPPGPFPEDPGGLLESNKMRQLLKKMIESNDIVIVDAPAFSEGEDAKILGELVDSVLLVVACGGPSRRRLTDVAIKIKESKLHIQGAVLNKVPNNTPFY
jgi:succinoglycan biosynthesis transport protein ExoP